MPLIIQPAFARGELSPSLYGRVDTAVYSVGLRTARNVLIHAFGGVSNRPGLQFIGPTKDHTAASRLIRFQFSTTDIYQLEFGAQYMRVVRDDGHVLEDSVVITGATQASPVVVTTSGAHGYSNGDEVFIDAVVGMTQLNGRRFVVANKTSTTFELTDQITGGNIDGTAYTAYSSAGTVARVYTLTTPYAAADLDEIKVTQSADVMTLVHTDYETRELTRTDHDSWTLSVVSFDPDQDHPISLTATQNGTTGSTEYRYAVTATADETLEESLPALNTTSATITGATAANPVVVTATAHPFLDGEEVEINSIAGMTELNGRRFIVANKTANTFELKGEDGTSHTAYSSGGTANLTFIKVTDGNATLSATNNITVSWAEITGASRYSVYKYDNGLYGLLGETETLSFKDDGGDAPDLDTAPPSQRLPFVGTGNYPGAVGYHEQRRVLGGTDNRPDTSYYTQTGAYSNLNISTPSQPNDAMTVTLTSQEVNQIRHYVSVSDLLIFTSGEEWKVNAGDNSGFSIETLRQKPQSRWGAGHQAPIVVGNVVLFVQGTNNIVRSIGYSLDIDGYTGSNMTILANHLFRSYGIKDWAYTASPDPLIVAVKTDGTAAALTFDQEQGVLAWTRWDTPNGKFESVSSGRPTLTDTYESHFFIVKRRLANGNTVRYIERTHDRSFEDVRDCFFLDSGKTLDVPVTITGITAADPVVVTATSHGFSDGDEVDLSDIVWEVDTDSFDNETQPDQLNNGRYVVANTTTHTFELTSTEDGSDIDGSAFNAYVEGGYARLAATTITGLEHLEGEAVVALADGNVVGGLTVSGRQITLARAASRVHVGKKYTADVETLNLEMAVTGSPTQQGRQKHVPAVTVRFERSRGLWAGPSFTELTEMKQREFEDYGEPTSLLTGDKEIMLPPDWNSNGRIALRQRDPLPMTILAIMPHVVLEDDR